MTMTMSRFGIGQIKDMQVPEGWSRTEQNNVDLSSMIIFTPSDDLEVQLGFYYRGTPISVRDGQAFRALLQTDKGSLAQDDLAGIRNVLADIADDSRFHIFSAGTSTFNGRRVLVVQGRWQANQYESFEMFIDAGKDGTVVQQIYFVAPPDKFDALLPSIKECLDSICWVDPAAD